MNQQPGSRDLVRIVLGVLLILLLIGGALWILGPFLPALIWATMIVVATWPLLLRLQRALGGRRSLAAAAMTGLLLVIVVAPLALAVSTIVQQAARLSDIKVAEIRIPMPPVWIEGVPIVGATLTAEWRVYAAATPEELASKAAPYVTPVVNWIASRAGAFGTFLLHLLLTLLLCGVLYVTGETAALGVRRFARRLQGGSGDRLVLLAAGWIRAVALGIVVTAIVQTALGSIGVFVAGAPYVAIFAGVMFVFCIAQLGPALPMLAAVGWLYLAGATTAAMGLFVWTVIVGLLDNEGHARVSLRSAHVHDSPRPSVSRCIDKRPQLVIAVEQAIQRSIVPLHRAVPMFRVDLDFHHARRVESALELLTSQAVEERRELLHFGRTQCLQHGVAEFVGVSNLFAASDQVTGRLVAFPCRASEKKVQAVPNAFEVTMGPVGDTVVIRRWRGVRIVFEDPHR